MCVRALRAGYAVYCVRACSSPLAAGAAVMPQSRRPTGRTGESRGDSALWADAEDLRSVAARADICRARLRHVCSLFLCVYLSLSLLPLLLIGRRSVQEEQGRVRVDREILDRNLRRCRQEGGHGRGGQEADRDGLPGGSVCGGTRQVQGRRERGRRLAHEPLLSRSGRGASCFSWQSSRSGGCKL